MPGSGNRPDLLRAEQRELNQISFTVPDDRGRFDRVTAWLACRRWRTRGRAGTCGSGAERADNT